MHKIDKMIAELDMDKLKQSIKPGLIEPYDYQWLVYAKCAEVIRNFGRDPKPSYVTASVSSGKTVMIAMLCSRFQEMQWEVLLLPGNPKSLTRMQVSFGILVLKILYIAHLLEERAPHIQSSALRKEQL